MMISRFPSTRHTQKRSQACFLMRRVNGNGFSNEKNRWIVIKYKSFLLGFLHCLPRMPFLENRVHQSMINNHRSAAWKLMPMKVDKAYIASLSHAKINCIENCKHIIDNTNLHIFSWAFLKLITWCVTISVGGMGVVLIKLRIYIPWLSFHGAVFGLFRNRIGLYFK